MSVASLGFRNVRGAFNHKLESMGSLIWTPKIASVFSSDQESEIYKFLAEVPVMRKQGASGAQGGPQIKRGLTDFGITVYNDIYESELYVNRHDKRRDKTGLMMARIGELAERAAELPDKLVSAMLETNGNSFDGVAFYHASSHASGANAITVNGISDPLAMTTTLAETVVRRLTQQVFLQKDTAGEPMNQFARKFLLMVHPDCLGVFAAAIRNLTTADSGVIVRSTTGALQDLGISYVLVANPRFTGNTNAYLFRIDGPIGSIIWQDELAADLIVLDETSEHAKKTGECLYRVERVCAAAYGRHQLTVRATMAA